MSENLFSDFDAFDLAEALYHWLQHHWEGQGDALYSDFCKLTAPGMFSPGAAARIDFITEEAKEVYDSLTRENYQQALERVLNYEPQG